MYQLYYYPRNASWAPHLLLEEMQVAYELVLVDRKVNAQKLEHYRRLNPTGRIPTLVHNKRVIFESGAICLYLCEQHPNTGLMPGEGDPLRANFYQWMFYLCATLQPELMVYFYPQRHTTDATQADAIKQAQEHRVTDIFRFLDAELKGKDFLVGGAVSACDAMLFMLSHWASGFRTSPLAMPHLGRYLRGIATREAVIKVCAVEGTSLAAYE